MRKRRGAVMNERAYSYHIRRKRLHKAYVLYDMMRRLERCACHKTVSGLKADFFKGGKAFHSVFKTHR